MVGGRLVGRWRHQNECHSIRGGKRRKAADAGQLAEALAGPVVASLACVLLGAARHGAQGCDRIGSMLYPAFARPVEALADTKEQGSFAAN
ncbi:hypothetical protein HK28_03190 [Acetobacter sp. DsW_063]|nr:hypothetical protein HK28_03190 [Acetobacter sp. DsW_063]